MSSKKSINDKEKSLAILAFNFLRIIQREKVIPIERAADILNNNIKNLEQNKFKTKIRRLYDVSKILMTIGIIKHVQQNKRSAQEWVGIQNMKDSILKIAGNKNLLYNDQTKNTNGKPSPQNFADQENIRKFIFKPCIDPRDSYQLLEKRPFLTC